MNLEALAPGAAGLALLVVGQSGALSRRRIGQLRRVTEGHTGSPRLANTSLATGPVGDLRVGGPAGLADPRITRAVAVLSGLTVAWVVGSLIGMVCGVGVAAVADRGLRKLEPAAARRYREQRRAALPIALDLLAVCLRTGMPLVGAAETVAAALPGPLATDLATAAALQRLGAPAPSAWADYTSDEALGPLARAVTRSAESGSQLADSLERLAQDLRAELAHAGEARVRRAGVVAIAPLGLCFLPAFICLGVAPVVLSLATGVLGNGTSMPGEVAP